MNASAKPKFRNAHRSFSGEQILIVTEDSVVEPTYFRMLADELKVDMNVYVEDEGFTDPLELVEHAIYRYNSESRFNRVYCVFDRNGHDNYEKALRAIERSYKSSKNGGVIAISSVPCFEYWFILHEGTCAKPYASCQELLSEMERIRRFKKLGFKKREKAKFIRPIFKDLYPDIGDAITNSEIVLNNHIGECDPHFENPSTRVHLLVKDMRKRSLRN